MTLAIMDFNLTGFIVVICLFLFLMLFLWPVSLLRIKYNIGRIRNDTMINSESINNETNYLYASNDTIQEYIPEYVLTKSFDSAYLMCKLEENIKFINIDIIIFNRKKKVLNCINFKENVNGAGRTRLIKLPQNTHEVTILVNEVNENKTMHHVVNKMSVGSVLLYSLINAVTVALFVILMQLLAFRFNMSASGTTVFYILTVILALATFIVSLLRLFRRNRLYMRGE